MKTLLLLLLLIGSTLAFDSCPSDSCEDSCKNRCGEKPNKRFTCQCNKHCEKFRDCCDDYSMCKYVDPNYIEEHHFEKNTDTDSNFIEDNFSEESNTDSNFIEDNFFEESTVEISNEDLKAISEKLYKSDVNKAADSDIVLNKQKLVDKNGKKKDLCHDPLYHHVNEDIFKKPTYATFIKLLDNYDRKTGTDETYSPEELKEQENFLQEIMKTKVMKELYAFFHKKGLYQSEKECFSDLKNMWFGLYSRSSGEKDSSGFEHVFAGEVKKGIVSGFHSWIRFYLLEKNGQLNYYSHNYDGPWKTYPDVLGKQFQWDGFVKEVGSQFIGSSPEFEVAMYTLCFMARPGKKCRLSMDGHDINIQTYEWTKSTYGNNKKFIATAYPVV